MANNSVGGKTKNSAASLKKAVDKALLALRQAREGLEAQGLDALTPEDRLHSAGRLREGEDKAMIAVLDAVDRQPGLFAALAPHDHGADDKKVETGPARDAIERRAVLAPLLDELDHLVTRVSDDMLSSGAKAKDVTVPAYAILKANADMSPELRKTAAPAIGFYARTAKRGKKADKAQDS